jgi:hypothetical protein
MSSGFISAKAIEERREKLGITAEQEDARKNAKPLAEQLAEQREAKRAEQEALTHQYNYQPPKALDEEECAFLDSTAQREQERRRREQNALRSGLSKFQREQAAQVVSEARDAAAVIGLEDANVLLEAPIASGPATLLLDRHDDAAITTSSGSGGIDGALAKMAAPASRSPTLSKRKPMQLRGATVMVARKRTREAEAAVVECKRAANQQQQSALSLLGSYGSDEEVD